MKQATPTLDAVSLIRECGLKHVAVIMDGNRRWAKERHLPTLLGHKQGVDALKTLVRYASDVGLEALTVYAFSTENWNRGQEEVGYLMKLFLDALAAELDAMHANNVRIRFIGDLAVLPKELLALIDTAHAKTEANTGLKFQIATNYGGRQEIVQALQALGQEIQSGLLTPDALTEADIERHLYTRGLPALDMLIRTGGEYRISNYLLWQCAYAELYTTETLWPAFSPSAFDAAIQEFAHRERRYGR
jgi:undecaprenyl diphosphate synthase